MGQVVAFLKSKQFLLHLLLSAVAGFMLLFVVYQWLNSYTNHGETITVPDLKGRKLRELNAFLSGKSFEVKISDSSVFLLDQPPGVVIDQDPAPNEKVKEGRTIYVTVTRTVPPQVKLPNLMDVSVKQAEAILASYGLRVGQQILKPDLAKNVVLAILFKSREMKPGDELPKGSSIDLVIGDGIGTTDVEVPSLTGLTLDEALFVLQGSSINTGSVVFDDEVRDTTLARVYRQVPEPGDSVFIKQGESIDLFLTESPEKIKR